MNLIKELTEKYNGKHFADPTPQAVSSPEKYIKNGQFEIEGSKISTYSKNKAPSAACCIMLHLKGDFQTSLEISPRSKFQKMIDSILKQKGRKIEQEFTIKGSLNLIENLVSNRKLAELLSREKVHLTIDAASPETINLHTEDEIHSLVQFEKYISILRLIETKILQLQLTAAY